MFEVVEFPMPHNVHKIFELCIFELELNIEYTIMLKKNYEFEE